MENTKKQEQPYIISGVSGCFSFAKYVNGWYEYNDNTDKGDVYNNIVTGKLMTEQQIFNEWLKLNNVKSMGNSCEEIQKHYEI